MSSVAGLPAIPATVSQYKQATAVGGHSYDSFIVTVHGLGWRSDVAERLIVFLANCRLYVSVA